MNNTDIKRFESIVAKLMGKEEKGDYEYMSLCPVHGDARLSLWTKLEESGKIHIMCHAGCSINAIVEQMGFKLSILYPAPQIVATYNTYLLRGNFYIKK